MNILRIDRKERARPRFEPGPSVDAEVAVTKLSGRNPAFAKAYDAFRDVEWSVEPARSIDPVRVRLFSVAAVLVAVISAGGIAAQNTVVSFIRMLIR